MAIPVMGFVLASRRPGNRIGWLALAAGLGLGLSSFADQYEQRALVAAPGSLPAGPAALWVSTWIWPISLAMVAFLFLLFPTGRLRSRRWRPAAWFVGSVFALSTAALMAGATREWAHPSASFQQLVSPPVLAAMVICFPAALVVSGSAIVVRFARSAGEERLQLKWFAAAAVLVVATFIALILTNSNSVAAAILNNLALLCNVDEERLARSQVRFFLVAVAAASIFPSLVAGQCPASAGLIEGPQVPSAPWPRSGQWAARMTVSLQPEADGRNYRSGLVFKNKAEGVGFEPTVTLPPQWFSRASVVYGSLPLLPASSVLADSSPSKIIPRISRV